MILPGGQNGGPCTIWVWKSTSSKRAEQDTKQFTILYRKNTSNSYFCARAFEHGVMNNKTDRFISEGWKNNSADVLCITKNQSQYYSDTKYNTISTES